MALGSVHFPRTPATSDHAGVMSRDDKIKLDALPSAADLAAEQRAQDNKLNALEDLCRSLEAASIARSASGNPVTIEDGADAVPVKSLMVQIAPVQAGSGDPSPDNIRPISGVTSVRVLRTGENLWNSGDQDASRLESYPYFATDLPPGTYTVHLKLSTPATRQLYWSVQDIYGSTLAQTSIPVGQTSAAYTFTINSKARRAYIYFGSQTGATLSVTLARGVAALPIGTPYQQQLVTVSLIDSNDDPLTVYGGTLNVTTGTLCVTWANIAGYAGETLPGRWISDRDVYAIGTSPTTGAQVCYELAAPVTYQLTPQEVTTLLGVNTIAADCGAVSVTYRADAGLAIDALERHYQDAIVALGANI